MGPVEFRSEWSGSPLRCFGLEKPSRRRKLEPSRRLRSLLSNCRAPFWHRGRPRGGGENAVRSRMVFANAIGRKARELLESLPEDQRPFNLPAVSSEHWWLVWTAINTLDFARRAR